ncbi:MAG: amidohydrolase [Alphaproteobacteria bacterium]
MKTTRLTGLLLGASLAAISIAAPATMGQEDEGRAAHQSSYKPMASVPTMITNVNIYDGRGGFIENGSIIMSGGDVIALGQDLTAPEGAVIIDGEGQWLTPGIIDVHSHYGVYASPNMNAHSDGNEITSPNTAEVWAEHGVWPQDPGFARAQAAGVTAMQILPGSANLIGGRGVTLKNVPARTVQAMKFPGAKQGVKFACGENPKRVYGQKGVSPFTRMGNVAGYRAAWAKATEYKRSWDEYNEKVADGEEASPPTRDLQMDTLMGVLNGEILIQNHCYRADDMANIIEVSKEFGFQVTAFHHAVESYKIADILAENDICSAMWADWWGFKMEAFDGIRENAALVHNAGACAIIHSDSGVGIQRLNQEAAKTVADAKKAGLDIPLAEAWSWVSYNAAKALGIEDQTGSLEPGKDADVVLWTANPFSVYARADKVYVDGALVYDMNDESTHAVSDFRLGFPGEGDDR